MIWHYYIFIQFNTWIMVQQIMLCIFDHLSHIIQYHLGGFGTRPLLFKHQDSSTLQGLHFFLKMPGLHIIITVGFFQLLV
jgi:hypothetical protein